MLLYHEPQTRTVVSQEHTCFNRHKHIETQEYAERKLLDADDERERVFRARWDREHLWRVKRMQQDQQAEQLELLKSITALGATKDADVSQAVDGDLEDGEHDGIESEAWALAQDRLANKEKGSGRWKAASLAPTLAGSSLPRLPGQQPRRDNRMGWFFGSTPQPGVGCRETFRCVHVYVSGDCWDMQSEKEALAVSMLPAMQSFLAAHRVDLVPVDCRIGSVVGGTYPLNVIRLVLDELDRCMPLMISFLGERYGWVPPVQYRKHVSLDEPRFDFLKALPQGLSLTHIELLYAYHWTSARRGSLEGKTDEVSGERGWRNCSFYLRDPKTLMHDNRLQGLYEQDDENIKRAEKDAFEKQVRELEAAHEAQAKKARRGPSQVVDKVLVQLMEGSDLAAGLAEEEEDEESDIQSTGELSGELVDEDDEAESKREDARTTADHEKEAHKKKNPPTTFSRRLLKHVFGRRIKKQGRVDLAALADVKDGDAGGVKAMEEASGHVQDHSRAQAHGNKKQVKGKKNENVLAKAGAVGLFGGATGALAGAFSAKKKKEEEFNSMNSSSSSDDDDDSSPDDEDVVLGANFGGGWISTRKPTASARQDGGEEVMTQGESGEEGEGAQAPLQMSGDGVRAEDWNTAMKAEERATIAEDSQPIPEKAMPNSEDECKDVEAGRIQSGAEPSADSGGKQEFLPKCQSTLVTVAEMHQVCKPGMGLIMETCVCMVEVLRNISRCVTLWKMQAVCAHGKPLQRGLGDCQNCA
jgi:hypothetical protein